MNEMRKLMETMEQMNEGLLPPEFGMDEDEIAKDAEHSYNYAKYTLRGRFPKGEDAISKSPKYSRLYAKHILGKEAPMESLSEDDNTYLKLYRFNRNATVEQSYLVPASSEEEARELLEKDDNDEYLDSTFFIRWDSDEYELEQVLPTSVPRK